LRGCLSPIPGPRQKLVGATGQKPQEGKKKWKKKKKKKKKKFALNCSFVEAFKVCGARKILLSHVEKLIRFIIF
jgi:hypothetical protein